MGRGRGGRRGGGGDEREDQYGGGFGSQDRDQQFSGGRGGKSGAGGGGFTGGGEAGGSKKGSQVSYTRQVPKFLQAHAHLLGKGAVASMAAPEGATLVQDVDSDKEGDFEHDDGGALQRAVADNPELAQQEPALLRLANKGRAAEIKTKGNTAFAAGIFDEAITHFTTCIQLDSENEVYYSNRAAAYISLKQYTKAIQDARRVIAIRPKWAKGHARLAAAHFALQDYSEAKQALQRASELEPDDAHLLESLQKADTMERREAEQHKHKFKRKDILHPSKNRSPSTKKQRTKPKLSFDDDDT